MEKARGRVRHREHSRGRTLGVVLGWSTDGLGLRRRYVGLRLGGGGGSGLIGVGSRLVEVLPWLR